MLALLIVLASIHVTRLLHDAVTSTVRSGVASGVGALSWIAFLPSALVFGIISKQIGVHTASWMIVAATVGVGILLIAMARRRAEPVVEQPEVALEERSSDRGHAWNLRGSGDLVSDLTCVKFVELVTAFLDGALDPITERRLVDHLPNCVGCERYLDQFRQTIHTLGDLPPQSLTSKEREALLAAIRGPPARTVSGFVTPGTWRPQPEPRPGWLARCAALTARHRVAGCSLRMSKIIKRPATRRPPEQGSGAEQDPQASLLVRLCCG